MKQLRLLVGLVVAAASAAMLQSCENTGSVGSLLLQTQSSVEVYDGFKLTGHSVTPDSIQSRTIMQLLGTIDAGEYGSLRSDFVTEFMPVARLDTIIKSIENIDSCKLLMMYNAGAFVGDSVVPMGLEVYRLNEPLPAPIYSNWPVEGKYDTKPLGSKIYAASNLSAQSDSAAKLSYREIYVDLPFSIAEKLYDIYKNNPEAYLSPSAFAKEFPGIYVRNSYGTGRVTKIGATFLQLYYHNVAKTEAGNDTIIKYTGNFYAATPEIISNNNIEFSLSRKAQDRVAQGEALIISPAGYDVEIEFPINDVIRYYNENKGALSVVNTLSMGIPVESVSNIYGINPPDKLLMILKSKKKEFFEQSKIPNDLTSYYATFNLATGSYHFPNMRGYFLDAMQSLKESGKDALDPEEYTFVLTPVYVETETSGSSYYSSGSTYVKTVTPYIEEPAMCRLMLEDATIKLTFTNQN